MDSVYNTVDQQQTRMYVLDILNIPEALIARIDDRVTIHQVWVGQLPGRHLLQTQPH